MLNFEYIKPFKSTLTNIVIAILNQERNPLTVKVGAAPGLPESVPDAAHIAKQLAIGERPAGQGVDHGGGLRVMAGDGLKDR